MTQSELNAEVRSRGLVPAWRNPTPSEIRFGYGAIHWGEFAPDEWKKDDGSWKKWIKGTDGRRWTR